MKKRLILDEKVPEEVVSDYIEVTHYIYIFPSNILLPFRETEKSATILYYKKLENLNKKEVTSIIHTNCLYVSCRINFHMQGGGMRRSGRYAD